MVRVDHTNNGTAFRALNKCVLVFGFQNMFIRRYRFELFAIAFWAR